MCNHDSDGDGISNGAELGDPDCTWRVGQAILQSAIGHPGIVFYPMWGMGKCIPIYYVATITCSGWEEKQMHLVNQWKAIAPPLFSIGDLLWLPLSA